MLCTRRLELELLNEKGAGSTNGARPAKPKDALLPRNLWHSRLERLLGSEQIPIRPDVG